MECKAVKVTDKAIKIEDEVIDTITSIDNYVDSFTIDELLLRPPFILNFDDQNIKDYIEGKDEMLHISNNVPYGFIDSKRDILKTVAKSASDNTEFTQKKIFMILLQVN